MTNLVNFSLYLTVLVLLMVSECKGNAGVIEEIKSTTESLMIPGGYDPSHRGQMCGDHYREVYKTICGEYPPGVMPTLQRVLCCKYPRSDTCRRSKQQFGPYSYKCRLNHLPVIIRNRRSHSKEIRYLAKSTPTALKVNCCLKGCYYGEIFTSCWSKIRNNY